VVSDRLMQIVRSMMFLQIPVKQ